MKICPLCKKENLEDAVICINCGFDLNPTSSAEETVKPNWLESFRVDPQNSQADPYSPETDNNPTDSTPQDSPDWLTRIRERNQVDQDFESIQNDHILQNTDKFNSKGTNELINSLRQDPLDPNADAEDLINRLRSDDEENYSFDLSADEDDRSSFISEKSTDLPINDEWVARFSQIENPSTDEPEEKTPKDRSVIPEWIKQHRTRNASERIEDAVESPVSNWIEKYGNNDESFLEKASDDQLPDWIQPSEDSGYENSEENVAESVPSWLDDQDTSESLEFTAEEEQSQPNWVNEINQQASTEDELLADDLLPDWITEDIQDDEIDLLRTSNTHSISTKEDEIKPQAGSRSMKWDAQNLGGEKGTGKKESGRMDEPAPPPFQLDQVPNWLENNEDLLNTSFFEEKETKEAFVPDSSNQIEPGELPAWLKAMRPLEAIVPTVIANLEKKHIERSGPLAGLKGVLSSQDSSQIYSPPPMYTSTLNITDKEKYQAAILDQLFKDETDFQTKSAPKTSFAAFIVRLVISLIILGSLTYSYLIPPAYIERPIVFPAETVRFASIVNGLILNADTTPLILVVIESEGASQSELQILTKSVFERFMLKNSGIAIVSSTPNGTLLGDNLIQNASVSNPSYNLDQRVTNLGYLPGGTTGIQGFLLNDSISLPSLSGDNSVSTSINGANGPFSRFDAVLLVTDNAESSKLWVEQISLLQPQTVMLVAAAAQSVPMLMPYVESNQIDGMEAGLYGAASYAQLIQSDNSTLWSFWNLQRIGAYIFILLIFAGGIWYLMQLIFKSRSSKSG